MAVITVSSVVVFCLMIEPAVEAVYQSITAPLVIVEADTVANPAPQIEAPIVVGAAGKLLITATTAVRCLDIQPVAVVLAPT